MLVNASSAKLQVQHHASRTWGCLGTSLSYIWYIKSTRCLLATSSQRYQQLLYPWHVFFPQRRTSRRPFLGLTGQTRNLNYQSTLLRDSLYHSPKRPISDFWKRRNALHRCRCFWQSGADFDEQNQDPHLFNSKPFFFLWSNECHCMSPSALWIERIFHSHFCSKLFRLTIQLPPPHGTQNQPSHRLPTPQYRLRNEKSSTVIVSEFRCLVQQSRRIVNQLLPCPRPSQPSHAERVSYSKTQYWSI